MKSIVIETEKLVKVFNKGEPNESKALDGIDIKIHAGELVILYGPSGCGKSTLLNCIAGLEEFEGGKVLIRGENIAEKKEDELALHRRSKIGMVFQQFNLIRGISVLNNIALPEVFNGEEVRLRIKRALELLRKFKLEKYADSLPSELSGGEQQKIALCRSLANNPWIILADEPTGNLDSKSAAEIIELIKNLNKKSKRTILMVTHNPDHLKIASRIIYMKDGKIEKETKK